MTENSMGYLPGLPVNINLSGQMYLLQLSGRTCLNSRLISGYQGEFSC
ncbi:MAG: hypothetical protein V3U88_10405 [Methylococcales bacterium]